MSDTEQRTSVVPLGVGDHGGGLGLDHRALFVVLGRAHMAGTSRALGFPRSPLQLEWRVDKLLFHTYLVASPLLNPTTMSATMDIGANEVWILGSTSLLPPPLVGI